MAEEDLILRIVHDISLLNNTHSHIHMHTYAHTHIWLARANGANVTNNSWAVKQKWEKCRENIYSIGSLIKY